MVLRIEYVQPEQLQRVLIARMLLDLNEITNTLMNGKSIDKMKKYKLFYQNIKFRIQLWNCGQNGLSQKINSLNKNL
ncbi:unnamed protein product (macronuclear) [Paramecium tetraurelia]|uniref:Uncharacterized protein n=1 Tax=Paramecium tetraurelia TaxID=5888 RepID=A0ECF8_PARTE|nr:uncharacterized protein GSPATT00003844001 [Paramecium tetraurelia]CAK92975.1 unnamed protein product [Paramecium tetraurelia]|eukprot:XP_001460372.1 hypothetical protein (macronuclear) [Paramecium tetraurelia strain d4-2]